MDNFNKIKSMSREEFADWLDEHGQFDRSPWMEWFNNKYCENCDSIDMEEIDGHCTECAYCEVHHECRFFPDKEEPNNKEVILMWLEEE